MVVAKLAVDGKTRDMYIQYPWPKPSMSAVLETRRPTTKKLHPAFAAGSVGLSKSNSMLLLHGALEMS